MALTAHHPERQHGREEQGFTDGAVARFAHRRARLAAGVALNGECVTPA